MYNKLVIGIDQSYQDTGISIAGDGKILKMSHISFEPSECHSEKRFKVAHKLTQILNLNLGKAKETIIIVERIRTFSGGNLSLDYIKSTGALIATIVDVGYKHGISVYSADTRSWKANVIGTSVPKANKYNVDPKKWPTVEYFIKQGYEADLLQPVSNRCKNYAKEIGGVKYIYNDNIADSGGIALYGFTKGRSLKKEV